MGCENVDRLSLPKHLCENVRIRRGIKFCLTFEFKYDPVLNPVCFDTSPPLRNSLHCFSSVSLADDEGHPVKYFTVYLCLIRKTL